MARKKGTFIVIEGNDGSGKATQANALVARLKKAKVPVQKIDFPQYENNFFGAFIGECLTGEHGDFLNLDPYIASIIYAADRFESRDTIEKWLAQGKVVIADRYLSSNALHQGGKIKDPKRRKRYLRWLEEMEHNAFGIPRPDYIVYLRVPVRVSLALLRSKSNQKKKTYLKGREDMVEKDIKYLENAQNQALAEIRRNNTWYDLACVRRKSLRGIEDIHEEIVEVLRPLLKKRGHRF